MNQFSLKSFTLTFLMIIIFGCSNDTSNNYNEDEADISRREQLNQINSADGIKFIGKSRVPIKLENGINYYGWLYNPKLDVAVIQYVAPGKLDESLKRQMALRLQQDWNGDMGKAFKKEGFKDIVIMITEPFSNPSTTIYSSSKSKWFSADDYLDSDFN
jgi:hypothetical protein